MDELEFEFDFTTVKDLKEFIESSGLPVGFYHAQVSKVELAKVNQKDVIRFIFFVLAGTNPAAIGKKHQENVFRDGSENSTRRLAHFASALGLVSQNQMGQRVKMSWGGAVERHCVIQIEEREGKDNSNPGQTKKYKNMAFMGIWSVADEKVAACPKNAQELAGAGIVLPVHPSPPPLPGATSAGGGSNGSASPGVPTAPGAPAAEPRNWGDV